MSIYNYLTTGRIKAIVEKLAPRFVGKDQDNLLALADEAAGTAYDQSYDYTNSVAGGLQSQLDAKVDVAGDTMTGKLTNNESIHIPSGTLVLGENAPESLYWYQTYPNNSYLTLDKQTEDNDASLVFTQGGRAKWEFGATTEAEGVSPRMHLKVVRNPDANPANDQFLDVLVGDYDTGDIWVTKDYKFGLGNLPTERFHISDNPVASRVIAKIENYNSIGGSKSASWSFQGGSSSWVLGNDYGLNGGHNFFIQDGTNGTIKLFADVSGVSIGGSTVASTEALRVDSTTQGVLLPRLTTAQRDAMGGKNAGLLIYNTTTARTEVWNGSAWSSVGVVDSGWTAATLQNGWVDFGGAYATAAYRKVGSRVYLRGTIKSGTGTGGTALLTLPTGFRPPAAVVFPVAAPDSPTVDARVEVSSAGVVTLGVTLTTVTYLSLNGIDFFVD